MHDPKSLLTRYAPRDHKQRPGNSSSLYVWEMPKS